jgi:ABC-type glutathione transport system ATPase component
MASLADRTAGGNAPVMEFRLSAWYGDRQVLDEATGELWPGEALSLVGLSGSGKSTLALALLGLLRYRGGRISGSVRLSGNELCQASERELREVRGRLIGYVPQNAAAALNGRLRVKTLLEETWRAHERRRPPEGLWEELLRRVQLPAKADFLDRRAGELSTGQGQRLLIALAVMHNPQLLIADEPTSALDAITQMAILDLFRDLNHRQNIALLFISHDLLSVASISGRVSILHKGHVVESGPTAQTFLAPQHPFTQELVAAMPAKPAFREMVSRLDVR